MVMHRFFQLSLLWLLFSAFSSTHAAAHPECSICLTDLTEEEQELDQILALHKSPTIAATAKDHCFHKDCIRTWLRENDTCPLCRKELVDGEHAALDITKPAPLVLFASRHYDTFLNAVRYNNRAGLMLILEQHPDININARIFHKHNALITAAAYGHVKILKDLINLGANINLGSHHDDTALMLAAQNGFSKTIKALLHAKAAVNLSNRDKRTALMTAAGKNYTIIMKMLIKAGANLNLTDTAGHTALLLATKKDYCEAVQVLAQAGADVNIPDDSGTTPLMIATRQNNCELMNTLLEYGATTETVNDEAETAWSIAASKKSKKLRALLHTILRK